MMENEHGRIDLLTQEQIDWCDECCDFEWFVKNDGKVYSKNEWVRFKNKKTIVSFIVDFGDCGNFDCFYCNSLESLEGSPKSVSGYFDCSECKSLKLLKGAPLNVGGCFNCSYCDSLKSLEGAPESVGGIFYCSYCYSLEYVDGLKNTKIKEKIYYSHSLKLEKYNFIFGDVNMFRRWQKSDLTTDDFLKEYSGFVEAKKYGI